METNIDGNIETHIYQAQMLHKDFDVNRLRVMLGEKTILGVIVMGDQTLSHPLHSLVAQRVDITSIRARLLEPEAPLADLIAEYWTQWVNSHLPQYA